MILLLEEMRISTAKLPDTIETMADFPDLGLRALLFGADTLFTEALPQRKTGDDVVRIWLVKDQFNCRYFLAEHGIEIERWLVGPYIVEDMTLSDITRLYQRIGLSHVDMNALRQYYLSLPHVRDESLMDSLINAHCITEYGAQGYELRSWRLEAESFPDPGEIKSRYTDHARNSMELRYAIERQMMASIAQGNYYGASMAIAKLGARNRESRAGSTLRDRKNYMIIFNTLCRVAAEMGNVPPLAIDRCSNLYALEIEAGASMNELRRIRDRMLKDYCDLVKDISTEEYGPLVRQAMDIISADLSEKVSLAAVAEKLSISPNYLSAVFKRETGKTFTEYLTEKRLAYAKQLLAETDQNVGEIAAACGIPDQNYFARLFKSKEKMTPLKYRSEAGEKKD